MGFGKFSILVSTVVVSQLSFLLQTREGELTPVCTFFELVLQQLLLTVLLAVYLIDFINLLYRDRMKLNRSRLYRQQFFSQNHHENGERILNGATGKTHVFQNHEQVELNQGEHEPNQSETSASAVTSGSQQMNSEHQPDQDASTTASEESTVFSISPTSHNDHLPKHPMNRNVVQLQIPSNTGILPIEEVKKYYRFLAKAYLSTFSKGIYRQMYFDILRRRTYALTPPGANKGAQTILFQIIDKKVYMMDPYEVPRNSKPFYRTRINQVIWLLSKLAAEERIPNTEFLMAIHDCVQTVNKPHEYRGAHYQESNPAFTIVTCNFSDNIPFPMWEGRKHRDGGFSGWDETVKRYAEDDVPWDQKQDRAVFRGGNRPSMYFKNKSDADLHCRNVGRTRLLYLSQQQPDVLDVSVGGTCGGVHSRLDRLEPREHHKYKYIVYAEGNCMWADRSRTQVFGPSTILKQETPCGQFFEPLMRPNTHYIPTDFFFTDTVERVLWLRRNDALAKSIVKNANEFGQNFLTLQGIEAYVEVLLEEYTKLLVEPEIKLETGAIDVTGRKV